MFLYSIRSLRRAPSFTVVAILSLGLGIGSATAIFSLLNTVLLKTLPYRQPDRLVSVREIVTPLSNTYPSLPVNYQHFLYWREHARSFEALAAIQSWGGVAYLAGNEPVKVDAAFVSANLFQLLGVRPQVGRSFLPEEGKPGHDQVAIITDSLWSRRFGRDPNLIGKTIALSDRPYTLVGVLAPTFHPFKNSELGPLTALGKNTEIFRPLTQANSNGWGGDYDYAVIGRLRPGVSLAQAMAELNALDHQIDVNHRLGEGLHVTCAPLQNMISAPVRTPLYVLMGAVMLLLLIVCVNLANLMFARSSARTREFSIRAALGAGRARLIAQILLETLLLGSAGGALGLMLAGIALHAFTSQTAIQIPRLDEVQVDGRVFLFALAVSLIGGLLSGLLPALRLTRLDGQESLRAGGHVAGTRHSMRVREILIGTEVAISVVLLFGAGLLTTSLARILSVDKGFTAEQAVAIDLSLPSVRYKTPRDDVRFWDRSLEALRSIPGVKYAAYTSKLPLTGESMVDGITVEGASREMLDPATQKLISINVRYVSPDYFKTLGIPLIRGRIFDAVDRGRTFAVISERLAAKVWAGQNPIGKNFTTGAMVGKATVIGVVKDVHATTLDQEPTLTVYVPYWHRGLGAGALVVRTANDPAGVISTLRQRVRELDPSIPIPQMTTMRQVVGESLSRRYFQVRLSNGFACAALLLALIGIYGVVAYHAAQRRTEVAVRLALGATRIDIFRLLIEAGLRPVAIGVVVGLAASLLSAKFLQTLLFGVRADDPFTLILVVLLLAATALCACVLPARHATRIQPAEALRYE
ncbi:MAG TPA: ABC transporter permease [Bryobacteraceae bacterium]|jgi:putative ABC transport system permease protein|nr:ABC transporter permease [Bryobacteraceae bacterium]